MVVSNVINDLIDSFFFLWSKWPSFFHLGSCVAITVWKMSLSARTAQYIFTEVHWIILMMFAHFHWALSCGLVRFPSPPGHGEDRKGQGLSHRDAGGFVSLDLFQCLRCCLTGPHLAFSFLTPDSVLELLCYSSRKIYSYCNWICKE